MSLVYCTTRSFPLCQSRVSYASRKCDFSNRKWAFPDSHHWIVFVPDYKVCETCSSTLSAGVMRYLQCCFHHRLWKHVATDSQFMKFNDLYQCRVVQLMFRVKGHSERVQRFFSNRKKNWRDIRTVQRATKGIKRCVSVAGVKLWNNINIH